MARRIDEKPKWWQWLMPRPINGVTSLLYVGGIVIYSYSYSLGLYPNAPPIGVAGGIIFLIVLALIALDRLEYLYYNDYPPWRILAMLLTVRISLILLAGLSDGFGWLFNNTLLMLLIPFAIFALFGSSYGLSGQAWVLYIIGRTRSVYGDNPSFERAPDLIFFIVMGMTFIFIISMAYLTRQEKNSRQQTEQLLRDLETSHRQLQNYAERVAELATTEERNRLAREIHDSLGHYMTVINVQLEKAMAFRERDAAEADRSVENAKHLASEALKDIRRSVSTLRDASDSFSLSQALTNLVNNLETSRFAIDLKIEGDETDYAHQSLLTLYRAAQEGLTNIQKHAQASQVTIHIQLESQAATLCIADNGQGFDPQILAKQKNGENYGLRGVKERLELIHGSFKLDSAPNGGTKLSITVPKDPLALPRGG